MSEDEGESRGDDAVGGGEIRADGGEETTPFDEVEVGESTTTAGRTITEADVVNFAGISGDFNDLHTDAEFMADSMFGERIAHGALVFSVMMGLLWQENSAGEEGSGVLAFYGVDELRFIGPTFFGDTVHVEAEVVEKEERDHPVASGVVRTKAEAVNQDGETVLSAELLALYE